MLLSLTAYRSSLNRRFPLFYKVSKPIHYKCSEKKNWSKHQTKKDPSEAFKLHELWKSVTVRVMDKKLHPTIYLQQMKNTVQTNLERGPEKQEREHHDPAKENPKWFFSSRNADLHNPKSALNSWYILSQSRFKKKVNKRVLSLQLEIGHFDLVGWSVIVIYYLLMSRVSLAFSLTRSILNSMNQCII